MPSPPTRSRRLLGWFAHPDDESWSAAGLLCMAARAGATVTIACATSGESGRDRAGRRTGVELARTRRAELTEACQILGATPPMIGEFPDGGLTEAAVAAEHWLVELLADLQPDVVVTLGRDGGYGHRDHLACTEMLTRACAQHADTIAPRVLHAVFPRGLFAPTLRGLREQRPECIDPSVTDDVLGVEQQRVDLRLPLDELRLVKERALAAHRSQLYDSDPRTLFYKKTVIAPLLNEEWFVVASGPPLPHSTRDPFDQLP